MSDHKTMLSKIFENWQEINLKLTKFPPIDITDLVELAFSTAGIEIANVHIKVFKIESIESSVIVYLIQTDNNRLHLINVSPTSIKKFEHREYQSLLQDIVNSIQEVANI